MTQQLWCEPPNRSPLESILCAWAGLQAGRGGRWVMSRGLPGDHHSKLDHLGSKPQPNISFCDCYAGSLHCPKWTINGILHPPETLFLLQGPPSPGGSIRSSGTHSELRPLPLLAGSPPTLLYPVLHLPSGFQVCLASGGYHLQREVRLGCLLPRLPPSQAPLSYSSGQAPYPSCPVPFQQPCPPSASRPKGGDGSQMWPARVPRRPCGLP